MQNSKISVLASIKSPLANVNTSSWLLLITIGLALAVSGCSEYKKRFGGKSDEYKFATTTKPLILSDKNNVLKPNDRFAIPNLPANVIADDSTQLAEQEVDISPPDYQITE